MSASKFRQNDSRTRSQNWDNPSFNRGYEEFQTDSSLNTEQGYLPNQRQQNPRNGFKPTSRFGGYEQEQFEQPTYRHEWEEQQNRPFHDAPQSNRNTDRQQYTGNRYAGSGQYGTGRDSQWERPDRLYARTSEPLSPNEQFNTQGYTSRVQPWESQNRQYSGNETNNWSDRSGNVLTINERGMLNNSYGPHKGKGPKGYQRSAERIKEDLSNMLTDDGIVDASDIEVHVENNNEVILSGSVSSREEKYRAEDLAESISGVSNVENRLHVNKENELNERKTIQSDNKNKRNAMVAANI